MESFLLFTFLFTCFICDFSKKKIFIFIFLLNFRKINVINVLIDIEIHAFSARVLHHLLFIYDAVSVLEIE